MSGAWTMTEDGEFILNEPFASQLLEAKRAASIAWQRAIYDYLAERTQYSVQQLQAEFARRVEEEGLTPVEIVDEFVIECLEGQL